MAKIFDHGQKSMFRLWTCGIWAGTNPGHILGRYKNKICLIPGQGFSEGDIDQVINLVSLSKHKNKIDLSIWKIMSR